MIQQDFRSRSRMKSPSPTPSVLRNTTPTPLKCHCDHCAVVFQLNNAEERRNGSLIHLIYSMHVTVSTIFDKWMTTHFHGRNTLCQNRLNFRLRPNKIFPDSLLAKSQDFRRKKLSDKNVTNTGHSSSASKESYTIFGTSAADGW